MTPSRSLLDDLEARGELDNTLVVLTSDNGYLMGEHRVFQRKEYAFEAAQPTAWIAGPGFRSGATSDAYVTNLDLAPTIVEATGATSGLAMDGRPIQDVLAEPDLGRDRFLPIYIPLPPPRPTGPCDPHVALQVRVTTPTGPRSCTTSSSTPTKRPMCPTILPHVPVKAQLRAHSSRRGRRVRAAAAVPAPPPRCSGRARGRPGSAVRPGRDPTRSARTSNAQRPRSGWGGTRAGVAAAQPPPWRRRSP